MLKKLLSPLVLGLLLQANAQVPNGSFESWSRDVTHSVPTHGEGVVTSNTTQFSQMLGMAAIEKVYHGEGYAARLTSDLDQSYDENSSIAYMFFGNSVDDQLSNGSPLTIQAPKSISFDARYDLDVEDKGWVVVGISTPLNDGFYPITFEISGMQEEMGIVTFDLPMELSAIVTDSIFIGFASGNPKAEIHSLTNFLEVDNIRINNDVQSILLPNGDLESWEDYTVDNFDNWFSSSFYMQGNVSAYEDASTDGDISILLQTTETGDSLNGYEITPATIILGYINEDEDITPIMPLATEPLSISFDYYYEVNEIDTALAILVYTGWDDASQTTVELGSSQVKLTNTPEGFVNVSFELPQYYSFVDSMYLAFTSSANESKGDSPQANSSLLIDNIQIEYSTATAVSATEASTLSVSPNPSNGNIVIAGSKAGDLLSVFDVQGRKVNEQILTSSSVSLSLEAGVYIYKINNNTGFLTIQ